MGERCRRPLLRSGVAIALTVAVAVLLVLSGSAGGPVARVQAQTQGLPEYQLVPGDTVQITVLGEADLTRAVTLRPDGRITLPLIGDIVATGLTPTQLAERLTTALKPFLRNPQVTVQVTGYQRAVVYMVGQFTRPGTVEIQRGWTVMEVIAVAGGVTPRAALRRATLIRRATGQTIQVDLERLLKGDRTADVPVEPGDILMVPSLQNRVLLLGSVSRPGAYDLDEDARIMDALALAGGIPDRAAANQVGVIRTGPDGKPVVTTVDVTKVFRGDMSQNVLLQNADIIYVPAGPLVRWTDILAWLSGLSLIRTFVGF